MCAGLPGGVPSATIPGAPIPTCSAKRQANLAFLLRVPTARPPPPPPAGIQWTASAALLPSQCQSRHCDAEPDCFDRLITRISRVSTRCHNGRRNTIKCSQKYFHPYLQVLGYCLITPENTASCLTLLTALLLERSV